MLEHASEQTPKRREALERHLDDARLTRRLAVIDRDAPVALDLDDVPPLVLDDARLSALRTTFLEYEFDSLVGGSGSSPTTASHPPRPSP